MPTVIIQEPFSSTSDPLGANPALRAENTKSCFSILIDVSIQHRQQSIDVGGITLLDHHIQYQSASSGTQIDLVPILHVPTGLDDNVGMRFKNTDDFCAAGTTSA